MNPEIRKFLDAARVGHLATVDSHGRPSVAPICFHVHKQHLYTVQEEKPKRADERRLQRVRNLAPNAYASVVVDRWDEDWRWLAGVHLRGVARTEEPGDLQRFAISLLRVKYPQYRELDLEGKSVIVLDIENVRTWGSLG
jgi:PPOX class probable F420-dependent enzyme